MLQVGSVLARSPKPLQNFTSMLCNRRQLCYSRPAFPGSSVVEQPAVNRLVAGSNPARGANFFKDLEMALRGRFHVGVP